ncbi:hypothetical protein DEU56DRAFT_728103 [Suillus clintonianus]|uniref:uncharacterized protein n=1 Tax=Suillus clintonianus TaxID=1904413 RepID=UPI001B86DE23|nr:uncharacterized protein DEU56DRAFT_728103 [Suillus clintonianus]KAG2151330.1 hypothetical protein DEU56DRAFT_728103 [Suillus clintonianus]
MAPSLVTSSQGHLPLLQPSPVRVLVDAIHQYQNSHSVENPSPSFENESRHPSPVPHNEIDVTEDPFRSSSTQTPNSFFESLTRMSPNDAVAGPSTPSPLNDFSRTLAAQEESKNNSKKRGKLMGNGLPCYLSGDAFYTRVVDHEKAAADEEAAKQARKEGREQRAAALEEWKKAEEARKQRNRELTGKYQMELERWKEEKERAKMEKCRLAWKKPTRGKLEAPLPKPVVAEGTAGDELDVDEDERENASDEDEEE